MTPSAQAAAQAEVLHQGRRQTAADQVPPTHDNCKWAVARHDHLPRFARKDGEVVTLQLLTLYDELVTYRP